MLSYGLAAASGLPRIALDQTLSPKYVVIFLYVFPHSALLLPLQCTPRIGLPTARASFKESHPAVQCLRGEGTTPRGGSPLKKQHAEHLRLIPCLAFGFSLVLLFACLNSFAQAASPSRVGP